MDHVIVKMILVLYVVAVILGYPLSISPTNTTLEKYTFNKYFKQGNARYWCMNFSRTFVCLVSAYLSIEVTSVLDKFIGIIGAVCCAPLAFLIPSLCHLKLVAKTNKEKVNDIIIIAVSIATMIFCILQTL